MNELKFKPKSLPEQTSLRLTFVSIGLVYQRIETFCTRKKSSRCRPSYSKFENNTIHVINLTDICTQINILNAK